MNNIIYISFYTEGYYEDVMLSHLLPTLKLFNLPYYILPMKNKRNRLKNLRLKIDFIQKALKENYPFSLVWIDADAKIESYPKLFYEIPEEYDIGLHFLDWKKQYGKHRTNKELLTGTVFLRNNEKVERAIELWRQSAEENSGWVEQRVLDKLIKTLDVKIYELPREYCYIPINPHGTPKVKIKNPVITQWQISRKIRKNPKLLLDEGSN